jgi:hypothetical protein
MLDPSSMVLYTVDAEYQGNEYYSQPKINRQMFHYGEDKLVQGRLYPQDNDGNNDVYTPYRNIVQQIIATIFDFPNLWTVSKGVDDAGKYIYSYGTHYKDYNYYDNCTLSKVKGVENENCFYVGEDPICIECGEEHDEEECINCCHMNGYKCADCGEWIEDEDDVYWVDDEPYCRDCVEYCEDCHEYHRGHSIDVGGYYDYHYVCEDCLSNYAVCPVCREYVCKDDAVYDEENGVYVHESCYEDKYAECDTCGTSHRREDMRENDDGTYTCDDCVEAEENEAC